VNVINRLFYYGVILPVSRLPFPVLYGLSNCLYYLFYYLIGYRKKVVMANLRNSFPKLSRDEHRQIAQKFYRHFCDLTLESLKIFSMSEKEIRQRLIYINTELPNRYFDQQRSVIIAGGHYNNWEYLALSMDLALKHQCRGIYKPLTNKFFDARIKETRGRFGMQLIGNREVKERFENEAHVCTATIFAIDQAPSMHSKPHWMTFLNQDTGVLTGSEKYAKEYNSPVIFGHLRKIRRGYYSFEFEMAVDNPRETQAGEITERITRMLENDILDRPEYWLWSHRRWKRKRPEVTPVTPHRAVPEVPETDRA
jgi:KDO2-lipid IV(A) lauroyltransferase